VAGTILAASLGMCVAVPRRKRMLEKQRGLLGGARRAQTTAARMAKDVSRAINELVQ